MQEEQLSEINRKLEFISNHYDFFKKKMLVLDKIETTILGNEYNKKGMSPIVDNFTETQVLDFSTFGDAVNLNTILKAAFGAAITYLGLTKYSGKKP